ncbi:MAG: TolC family protein [Limnochordia bacterium]|nr:TolC family protein [Limnochordia bacterium]
MKNKHRIALVVSFTLVMLLSFSQVSWATMPKAIILEEALKLAFQHNTSHALFLWEQELAAEREALEKHPHVTAKTDPVGIRDGQFQGPTGSVLLRIPLGENLDLSGTVTLGLQDKGVRLTPAGSLELDYKFLSLAEKPGGGPTPEENRRRQVNNLILQTVDLLVQLRKQLDLRGYEEDRLRHLEASLEAARQTPDYDDLELRKQLRDQVAALAMIGETHDQLQLQLVTLLGASDAALYDPVVRLQDFSATLSEEELQTELFSSSTSLRQAQEALTLAQARLDRERKTRGWDVNASGGIRVNEGKEGDPGWNWDVALSATKTLYPRNIILAELEFAVAQAEHALETQENSLLGELRGAIQVVKSAQDQVQLKGEHLAEARDDLAFRRRQYEAGLVTGLQVQDTALILRKAELDYDHEKMLYAQQVLTLWNLCGRDLQAVVYTVIN